MTIGEPVPKEQTIIEPSTGEKPVIKVEPPQEIFEKERKIIRNKRLLWYVLSVLEVSLAFRFLLKLFGANPSNIFSILIGLLTFPFTFIFNGLFPSSFSNTGEMVIEWSTLFAMFFYAVLALLISRFYKFRKPIDPKEAEEKAEKIMP